jgi:hypothetical protein
MACRIEYHIDLFREGGGGKRDDQNGYATTIVISIILSLVL